MIYKLVEISKASNIFLKIVRKTTINAYSYGRIIADILVNVIQSVGTK